MFNLWRLGGAVLLAVAFGCGHQSVDDPAISGGKSWTPSTQGTLALAPETTFGNFTIRPPKGLTFAAEAQSALAPMEEEIPSADVRFHFRPALFKWTGNKSNTELSVELIDKSIGGPFRVMTPSGPATVTETRTEPPDDPKELLNVLMHEPHRVYNPDLGFIPPTPDYDDRKISNVDSGTLNGMRFARLYWSATFTPTGDKLHGFYYVASDDSTEVIIRATVPDNDGLADLREFDASALTLQSTAGFTGIPPASDSQPPPRAATSTSPFNSSPSTSYQPPVEQTSPTYQGDNPAYQPQQPEDGQSTQQSYQPPPQQPMSTQDNQSAQPAYQSPSQQDSTSNSTSTPDSGNQPAPSDSQPTSPQGQQLPAGGDSAPPGGTTQPNNQ